MKRRERRRRGFTLIELLVVIVIISMLAGFVAPNIYNRVTKAKKDLARPRMITIENALQRFQLDCGRLPDDAEGLDVLVGPAPAGLENDWQGPYLKESQLLDPWGNPYLYFSEGQYNPGSYDIISYGADGRQGGEDENTDVWND